MKKIICILLSLVITGSASFAQDKADKNAKTNKSQAAGHVTKTKPSAATNSTAAAAKGEGKSMPEAAGKTAVKTKKDGTPDMRYKANKESVKPTGKLKSDGTPDKRYKANKDAANTK